MKHLKFSISPLFLVLGAFLIYFKAGSLFAFYLVAILLHELGHAFVAKKLGYELNAIKLMPYGTELSINSSIKNLNDDLIISLAGPIVNLFLIIVTLAVWWVEPSIYIYTETFVIANIISFMFNLLPVFPLDGGRVALNLLNRKLEREKAFKIMQKFGAVVAILFFLMFLTTLFTKMNITFFIISFFLMESALTNNDVIHYQTIFALNSDVKPLKRKKTVKHIAIGSHESIMKALKSLKPHLFTVFYVLDDKRNIKKVITQVELIEKLKNFDSSEKFNKLL